MRLINSPPVLVPETKKDGVGAEKTDGWGWGWGLTPLEASIPPRKSVAGIVWLKPQEGPQWEK